MKTDEVWEHPTQGVFIFIGFKPNTYFLDDHPAHDVGGHLITNDRMETSVPGLFAAGDIRSQLVRQITNAVGDATVAALAAEKYITHLKHMQSGTGASIMSVDTRSAGTVERAVVARFGAGHQILAFAEFLLLGLWIGSMAFFSFAVAPGAFETLGTREMAGRIVTSNIIKVEWLGLRNRPALDPDSGGDLEVAARRLRSSKRFN